MTAAVLFQKIIFRLRMKDPVRSWMRRIWWSLQGARFGRGTIIPAMRVSWPHQLSIGRNCILEHDIFFKFDGWWLPGPSIVIGDGVFLGNHCEFNIRARIDIGNQCLIASGCKFIDHDHAIEPVGSWKGLKGREEDIVLEEQVWLGANVIVLRGVRIGRGAIVGAGAVVTKSIPANEIWAGMPARRIGCRPAAVETGRPR